MEDFPIAELSAVRLDEEVVEWFMKAARANLRSRFDSGDLLENRLLVRSEGDKTLLTTAGYLLFCRNPMDLAPGAYVRFLRFEGVEQAVGRRQNLVKDQQFTGPIPKVIIQLRAFIPTQIKEYSYLGAGGGFIKNPEYPEVVWDEALVNAIIHRIYGGIHLNEPIFVRQFDDRLEVTSPGAFPQDVGPGRFLHRPRNPHLMHALRLIENVEMMGEGTRRMFQEMEIYQLPPPEYSEPHGQYVRLVLRNGLGSGRVLPNGPRPEPDSRLVDVREDLRILKSRLVRGEIDEATYYRLKEELLRVEEIGAERPPV